MSRQLLCRVCSEGKSVSACAVYRNPLAFRVKRWFAGIIPLRVCLLYCHTENFPTPPFPLHFGILKTRTTESTDLRIANPVNIHSACELVVAKRMRFRRTAPKPSLLLLSLLIPLLPLSHYSVLRLLLFSVTLKFLNFITFPFGF